MGARAAKPPLMIRLAALGLIVLVFLTSLALAATPIAWLWLLSNLSLSTGEFYALALLGCPTVIIGWALLAVRLNALYQELTRTNTRVVLEASVTAGVVIAFAAMTFWFFAGSGGTHLGP
jgi:hypothetical protein